MADRPHRRRSVVWPIILIGIGVILLLQNFGMLPWSFWEQLARFWPVILILIGIELILNRSNPWLAAILTVVVLAVVIVGGTTMVATGYWRASTGSSTEGTERIVQELPQQDRATVEIQFGAGDLTLSSLDADSGNLMEGDFTKAEGSSISRSFTCRNNNCVMRLGSRARRGPFFGTLKEEWRLGLNPRLPLEVHAQTGASRLNMDLSALRVTKLNMDIGASSGTITLPLQGTNATVKVGAADVEIIVPAQTAARIRVQTGLSSVQVDQQRFPRNGDYYVSPGYDQAQNRVDLQVDAGASSIRIR